MSNSDNPKVILITGCSSGFGMLMAARFAEYGEQVVASMRHVEDQTALQSEVKGRGAEVDVQSLDVTDPQSIKNLMEYVSREYGYVDILINNAGYGIGGAFEDLTDEEFRAQMETNFFGVLNVTRAVIPFMRHRPNTKIINMSSVSGFIGTPCFSAYVSSKFALEGWSQSLKYELKQFNIDVCLVRPGSYKTKIFYENKKLAKKFADPQSPYKDLSQHVAKLTDKQLEDNHKDPEEVADLVEKIIYRTNPPFYSIPDLESKILYFLYRVLPFGVWFAIISRAILPGKNDKR